MRQIPDHPDIRRTERTGYPNRLPEARLTCDWCGAAIRDGDEYFDIRGEILCFDCGTDCLRRAEE